MFPFHPSENIRKPLVFSYFQGDQKGTLGSNDLISQVLSVVPLGQCLSNLFLKWKESLVVYEIIGNNGSIVM